MKKLLFFYCLLFYGMHSVGQETNLLGQGLVIFTNRATQGFTTPIRLYKDSLRKEVLMDITLAETNCPTCMQCAEPTHFYKGRIQPFHCSGREGLSFSCRKVAASSYEISIDTATTAYVGKEIGVFYTWDEYLRKRAKQGDYFKFIRDWDSTVLYDKPYNLQKLPVPARNRLVGLAIHNIEDMRFYPVQVQGYWLQLKMVANQRAIGYCWVIWRTDKEWLIQFPFRID